MKHSVKAWKTIAGILLLLFALTLPYLNRSPYYIDLWIMTMVRAVLGMVFILMLRNGLINMGIVAFWGLGAYASVTFTMKLGLSFWVSIPLSILFVGVIALILGRLMLGGGSGGFSFVTLSMVIGMLFSVVAGNIKALGGYSGVSKIPRPNGFSIGSLTIDFSTKTQFYYLALVFLLIIILVLKAFYSSWAGRAWDCIGLNYELARSVGIDTYRYRMMAFVLGSMLCGLDGVFFAHYSGFVTPDGFSMWMNMYVQIYAILGGMAFPIAGPLVGAFIMTVLPEMLRITTTTASLLTGLLLIILILVLPQGVLSLFFGRDAAERLVKIRNRLKQKKEPAGGDEP